MIAAANKGRADGIALIAVLMAMTLLLLLALPFAVSMSRGAEVATHAIEERQAEQLSASARELLLANAAFGHPTYDETPNADDRTEYPEGVPQAFPQLRDEGRARLGGEVEDLSRFVATSAMTPLVLANLLGSTAHLAADLKGDDATIRLDDASGWPEQGLCWVDHEVIRYGSRSGNQLLELERGALQDLGFLKPIDHEVGESAPVYDFRLVLACAWPFFGRTGGTRDARVELGSVEELIEVREAGCGGFSPQELDVLRRAIAGHGHAETAPTWGRPERVFRDLVPGVWPPQRMLTVRSALHLGAGSPVRLRNLRTGAAEHNLVMSTSSIGGTTDLLLPSEFQLHLLFPVAQAFPAMDTVVEPLVPAPVNVNTASVDVLAAVFAGARRAGEVRVHEGAQGQRPVPPSPISSGEARALAEEIAAHRQQQGAIPGFEEFATQFFGPRFDADSTQQAALRWIYLYRQILTGRDSVLEMGTAPICFRSGPLVRYRAAAAIQRSLAAPAIAARHERQGLAVALPGLPLQAPWQTQEQLEECFRLDQRSPYWLTAPVNTGAVGGGGAGVDPISRYTAHIVGMAFPSANLGQARFPSRDLAQATFQPGPVSIRAGRWLREEQGHEAFSTALDPRGHEVSRQGAFAIRNTGPRDRGGAAGAGGGGAHVLTHGFTTGGGAADRFGISAWFEPQALGPATLFDYAAGDRERNRMALLVRDGNLVFEVIDEAGLDPDPSQSPAGVQRTAAQWQLPLAELGLPPRTPLHASVAAYGNRPSDLSVAIDGMTRGKVLYRTFLTAPITPFDPQQSPERRPSQQLRDPRYLMVQVESTDGFPPQGVLRIGLELFEYTSINGNSFVCVFADSVGGRGARQSAFEHRPSLPTDANGRPTISYEQLLQQGINLDFFPDHPVGAEVELYGYSAPLSQDTVLNIRETALATPVGGFAIARGFVQNGRPIVLTVQGGSGSITLGSGLDQSATNEIQLKDPPRAGRQLGNNPAQEPDAPEEVLSAFQTGGGYALLVQYRMSFTPPLGQIGATSEVGGVEVIRYGQRTGTRLTGIQRNVTLPGDNGQIQSSFFDGQARQFVTDWELTTGGAPPLPFDTIPQMVLWVVPISLAMQDASNLADPTDNGIVEWLQLLPRGDSTDTEWVRYDAIVQGRDVVRSNRARWANLWFALTQQRGTEQIQVGPQGSTNSRGNWPLDAREIWGDVTPTSGHIGYVPQIESTYPEFFAARQALAFRGDPATGTSAHPQPNSSVLPCHRLQLHWGNHGAMTGRPHRHDRVALVSGSSASGTNRPSVEWHTVNWSMRRYGTDQTAQGQQPPELLGPQPFQLVAFRGPVLNAFIGPNQEDVRDDVRFLDRLVKFPSGELPTAACENLTAGGSNDGGDPLNGFVDEIAVTDQMPHDCVVDFAFDANAAEFAVALTIAVEPQGPRVYGQTVWESWPAGGGLVQIDGEVLAYSRVADGRFQIAQNGRGLLGTEPRAHDRGASVHFLTHRPAAILSSGVQPTSHQLPVQALGAMSPSFGTLLLARTELLHYTWGRQAGDQVSFEMPRHFEDPQGGGRERGLFRGRFGTNPVGAGAGEPVIAFPFRYWDRYVERSDDPELAYFQMTAHEAPVFFRSLRWREETTDPTVDVVCLLRADELAPWTDEPGGRHLRLLERSAGQDQAIPLALHATQLELRFAATYAPGCLDLVAFTAHGWKTAPRVAEVQLEYEGEGRVLAERVTAR